MKQFANYPEEIRERAMKLAFKIEAAIENVALDFEPTEEELDCLDAYWGWERTEIEQWIRQGRSLSEHPKRILCITLSYSEGISKHKMLEVPFQKTPDGPVFEESLSEFEEGAKMESIVMDNFWRGYELEPPKI